jgi:hypothetical protein
VSFCHYRGFVRIVSIGSILFFGKGVAFVEGHSSTLPQHHPMYIVCFSVKLQSLIITGNKCSFRAHIRKEDEQKVGQAWFVEIEHRSDQALSLQQVLQHPRNYHAIPPLLRIEPNAFCHLEDNVTAN